MIKKDKRILSTQPLEDLSDVLLSNYLQYCCLCLAALSLNNYYGDLHILVLIHSLLISSDQGYICDCH